MARRFPQPLSLLVLVLLLPLLLSARAAGQTGQTGQTGKSGKVVRFVPDPAKSEVPLSGQTWRFVSDALHAELQKIDDAQRLAYIRHRTGLELDPFAFNGDRGGRFETFVLILENRGEAQLQFSAWNVWLMPNTQRVETPLDVEQMRSAYRLLETEMPPAYERVGKALFQPVVSLPPGEKAAGLLVFRFDDPKAKRYTVEVPVTLSDGERSGFKVAYRRVKE